MFTFAVEFVNSHLILGQSGGLAADDLINSAELLGGIKLSNQDILLVHSHDAESKRHSNSEWETLRNGHDNKHDSDVEEANDSVDEQTRVALSNDCSHS